MKKLLIIEDHPMMRMFLQNYLSKSYEVTTVSTPEEALDYSTKNTFPDLILSDYKDKQSKDFQMLQCLCMQIEWRNIPLFVLTDQDKSQERINALELGAKDTLSKPFNPKELVMRIDAMLHVSSLNTIRTVA
ncbi:hypothetical protein BFP97_04970 [Roseivirga sp. 4D4]|uniref:response regulator n=1 Tax=Roseivirga sp. 4D4 TaxID=1889784 RepID=UPI0008539A2A|nr:response regulator [Roseivirga sp. 4D4]OEK00901.1 hypothetical protein BFP97_04970 [Roseivirga sp. 4D4]